MTHIQIIISIIIGAGLLGGLTNYIISFKLNYKPKEIKIQLFKSLLLGVCAAITVPLFLQILSNNLLDVPDNGIFPNKNYLIFSGFCILAAIFSKRFLEDLYSKVKHLEKENEEVKKELHDNAQKTKDVDRKIGNLEENLEESVDSNVPTDIKDSLISNQRLLLNDAEVQQIITSLFSTTYSFRTVIGISKETNLPEDKIKSTLEYLSEMGFAERRVSYKGVDLWRLLKYPIKIYSASYGIPGSMVDVTLQIQELVSKGIHEDVVLPSTFRIADPAPGVAKSLKIHCRIRGRETELFFTDGETFKII